MFCSVSILEHKRRQHSALLGVVRELVLVPHVGVVGEADLRRGHVGREQPPRVGAQPEHHAQGGVDEDLGEVVRTRHVLEHPAPRDLIARRHDVA